MAEIMDVSRYQGNIDWEKVKASGLVSGVMLRTRRTLRKSRSKENIMSSTAYAHVRFLDGTLADYQTERTTNHETFKR